MNREQFLSQNKRRYKTLRLPTGDDVTIQSLTAAEMRTFRESLADKKGELIKERGEKFNELLLALCLVDDHKQVMFTEADAMGGAFDQLDGLVILKLAEECREWTGFKGDSDFSAIEDAIKNSESVQENNGSTESQQNLDAQTLAS